MVTVLKRMSEVGDNPLAYTRIARTKKGKYIIYTDTNGTEVAFTSFSANQIGHAVHLNGNNSTQEFFYASGGPDSGLKLSGPHDLLGSIMDGSMKAEV